MITFNLLCIMGWGCAGGAGGAGTGTPPVDSNAEPPVSATTTQKPSVAAGADGHATVRLFPPGQDPVEVDAEVVYTPSGRQQGLMYRRELGADAGMLFLFRTEGPQSFWMRNTYLPLDMLFIRSDMTVLGVVENAEPLTETSRRVPGRSQYVLEVNAGYCREHGIGEGTKVEYEGVEDELAAIR